MSTATISMKRSIRSRIRFTKRGKALRRPMGIGHNKAKHGASQRSRKRRQRGFKSVDLQSIKKHL